MLPPTMKVLGRSKIRSRLVACTYGTIPGLGTGPIRTAAALGIAPSSVTGSNLYMW
jgi:hypothetical protein